MAGFLVDRSIERGEGNGGDVFAAVLSLLDQLGDFIPHAGTKAFIRWAVFVGVVTSKEIAGFDEELGYYVLEVVVDVVVEVGFSKLGCDVVALVEVFEVFEVFICLGGYFVLCGKGDQLFDAVSDRIARAGREKFENFRGCVEWKGDGARGHSEAPIAQK